MNEILLREKILTHVDVTKYHVFERTFRRNALETTAIDLLKAKLSGSRFHCILKNESKE